MNADEEQQFVAFVRSKGDRLLHFARMMIPDRGESEDALQIAMTRLAKHWPRGITSPEAYARATLVNLARDGARRRHLVAVPREEVHATQGRTEDHADAYAAQERLTGLLAVLPGRQRVTVVLRVIEGYSERETADLMRCSPGTVKSNLARGLAALRVHASSEVST